MPDFLIRSYSHASRWSVMAALDEALPQPEPQTPDERLRHGEVVVLVRITPPERPVHA